MNSYNKTTWINGQAPALSAENLNNIENGIEAVTNEVIKSVQNVQLNGSTPYPNVDSAIENDIVYRVFAEGSGNPRGWLWFCGSKYYVDVEVAQIRIDREGKLYRRVGIANKGTVTWGSTWEQIDITAIDLSQYAKKAELPTKVSDLTNDSGFIDIDQMKDALISKANAPIIKHESLTPSSTETAKLFNFSDGTAHDWSNSAAYSVFAVQGGALYLMSGKTAANTESYSLGGFFDDQDNLLETFGKEGNNRYEDYPVIAPTGAAKVYVNGDNAAKYPIYCCTAEYDSDCISEMLQMIIDNKAEIKRLDPALDKSDNIFYFTDTTNRTVGDVTLEFLSNSSVKVNGTPTNYLYLGIMGGDGDKKGVVVNSKEAYSGSFSLRLVESGGTGAVLRYGAAKAAGTTMNNDETVTLEDQYFSFRIVPNKTYTDYIVEIMLTPTEEPEAFHPYNEVLGANDPVARSYATPERFVDLCNHVQPQKILTWIDDDTSNTTAIQSVMDIADELGIRCSFASITGNWTTAIVDKLKEAQNKGFHIFSHGHSSHSFWRDTSKTLLDLDGDLALSLSELRQNGFVDSDMIAYPGGVVSARPDITKIARKWCRCGVQDYVAAGGKYITGYGKGRYLINRKIIDKSVHADAAYYTDALDAFSDNDAPWYLFATHSAQTSTTFDADLVKAILQHAMDNGWTVMTLNEAFHYRERYYQIQEMFGLN